MGVASKPNQKVDPLGGPFGPTAISKSCFRNFQGRIPRSPFEECFYACFMAFRCSSSQGMIFVQF